MGKAFFGEDEMVADVLAMSRDDVKAGSFSALDPATMTAHNGTPDDSKECVLCWREDVRHGERGIGGVVLGYMLRLIPRT